MTKTYSMDSLKEKLAELSDVIPTHSSVVYLDYPLYGNVGDLLIMKGTEAFFNAYGIHVRERWNAENFIPGRKMPKDAIFVCQGGGNFGDLYPHFQQFRERVIEHYPNNRIVILPQSIYYENEENIKRTKDILTAHPDLHLFTREKASFQFAKRHFQGMKNIRMMPDMAHQLWPLEPAEKPSEPVLRFIRTDKEANESLQEAGEPDTYDWPVMLSDSDKRGIKRLQTLNALNKKAGNLLPIAHYWKRYSDRLVNKSVRFFSRYESVVTSRLHGHILSCLLQKENVVIDNSYGKNANYYNTWMKDIPNTKLIQENGAKTEEPPVLV
ncbi:polysaccharide pyruvyl transferase family protein [Bacillus sonorensis]|uniref:Polysaccharide pyruvyl transferase EpsO n=2 Tax=Bacillus sonorensis TaxID=119858 RepID=M5PBS9_9BACI|nr:MULTISPECIES: polysaccharide pyruvyl transferase family protein [Bacillus]TWK79524.1 putative pyruvyl transferase EpsO [Bacillus paralicheniformis]ASB87274.1 Putative pyruvyl transferase EpsO [Bacillus sonorensis]EME73245.1 polysaccharide pyruvyl transferase EpsO [Bacillus sonorensis L12]MBG9914238.1 pyruvyl transferase [Bacillus sonorensis]MCY7857554.1 polysaccharide pyruvyl transferase family protein [Bacillus sonorensis]